MLHLGVAAALQNVGKAHHIAFNVRMRVLQRIAHARLRRQMNDSVKLLTGKQTGDAITIRHIELHKGEVFARREATEAAVFEIDIVVIVEVVKPHDLVAARQKLQCRGHANKARCARE